MAKGAGRRFGQSAARTAWGAALSTALAAGMAALGMLGMAASAARAADAPGRKRAVEVVFVIDTTGSMGWLIEAAKQKVWAIANEIAKGKPAPDIRMGLVAYRDRGDQYVTKTFDLTKNLDQMYKELLALRADGGGDGPEHALQGLSDAVEKMSWSKDTKTFKVAYLVGDAPAHLDYHDTPSLEALLQAAVRKGVVVNAVQCGDDGSTTAQWTQIARLGEGKFLAIPQDGGVVAVATPFDERLSRLNSELDGTMLAFGRRREEARAMMTLAGEVAAGAPAPASAERASFKAKRGFDGELDLAQAVTDKKADLAKLRDEELPDSFRGLNAAEREKRLAEVNRKREGLRKQIEGLSLERSSYLKEHARTASKDSFDAKLVETLKEQAGKQGILY